MSYHVLHILKHGAMLAKDRGFIICKAEDKIIGRLPIEDIRAIIIAARGVTLSSSIISAILENNGIILHCDEKYIPCGISSPIERIVDPRIIFAQGNRDLKIHERLWELILKAKIKNQASLLRELGVPSQYLEFQKKSSHPSESNCSLKYWQRFFAKLGEQRLSRRNDDSPINQNLNYGYAVLRALVHRSIIVHGLIPLFGCHHIPRAKAHPLVYDLMEPLRPFIDKMLYFYEISDSAKDIKNWAKFVATEFVNLKIIRRKNKIKILDAIDVYVSSYANALAEKSITKLWLPEMEMVKNGEPLQNGLVGSNV